MDEVAERGYAAHWKYKESFNISSKLDNWLDRIKEMIESPDSDALSFIDDVKGFFFLDEISVFTPSGELRTLPAKSSVLDFAYAIHSEIGTTCVGAKVDKKLVPINHVLQNGEQIEIITSKNQTPKDEWLSYVVTTRAKSNIKLGLKREKKKYYKQGKEKLEKLFLRNEVEFTHENIRKFIKINNISSLIDLYYTVAHDRIGQKEVKFYAASALKPGWLNFMIHPMRKAHPDEQITESSQVMRNGASKSKEAIPNGVHQLGYEISKCCNPIPGDEIIGLDLSPDKPIQIHRTKCVKAQELMASFGNRVVKIDWKNQESISFLAGIKISGLDKMGMINDITKIISNELNLNIKSFHLEAKNGLTEGEVLLYVRDTDTLNHLLSDLHRIDGIKKVARVD